MARYPVPARDRPRPNQRTSWGCNRPAGKGRRAVRRMWASCARSRYWLRAAVPPATSAVPSRTCPRMPTSSAAAAMTHPRPVAIRTSSRTLGLVRLRKSCARTRSAAVCAGRTAPWAGMVPPPTGMRPMGRSLATAVLRVLLSLVRCIPFPSTLLRYGSCVMVVFTPHTDGRWRRLVRPLRHRGIAGHSGMRRMQGLHERHQCGDLRRTEILAIGRHIAAALDHLPDQLVAGQARRHIVERRAALAAAAAQAVAVPALLVLEHQGPLDFERRAALEIVRGYWRAAPGLHRWGPGRVHPHRRQSTKHQEDDHHGQHSDWPPARAFLPRASDERQGKEQGNADNRRDEDEKGFQIIREQGQEGIEPEKIEIRLRYRPDIRGIRYTLWPFRAEVGGAAENAQDHQTAKDQVFADGLWHERHPFPLQQRLVFGLVCGCGDLPPWLGVFIDAFGEHQAQVHGDERQDEAGDDEDVEREEARQRLARNDRPGEHQAHEIRPDERDTPHHRRPDAQPPVGILVKAHYLPRKGHPQRA